MLILYAFWDILKWLCLLRLVLLEKYNFIGHIFTVAWKLHVHKVFLYEYKLIILEGHSEAVAVTDGDASMTLL
jgi:hypothetical protein